MIMKWPVYNLKKMASHRYFTLGHINKVKLLRMLMYYILVTLWRTSFEFFSQPLMSYCVPGSLAKLIDKGNSIIAYFNSFDIFNKLTSDLARAWREILQLCVLALGIICCYIYICVIFYNGRKSYYRWQTLSI